MTRPRPFRARWKRLLLPLCAAGILTSVAVSVHADNENWCPGSPWNCVTHQTCGDLYWCQDDKQYCGFLGDFYVYKKYQILKRCTFQSFVRYCISCGPATKVGDCCGLTTQEQECRDSAECP